MGVFLVYNLGHNSRGMEQQNSFFDLESSYFVLPFEPTFVRKTQDFSNRNLQSLCFHVLLNKCGQRQTFENWISLEIIQLQNIYVHMLVQAYLELYFSFWQKTRQ